MAGTVIDALVVELGLDVKGMEAGRKQVEQTFKKTGQAVDEAGKHVDDAGRKMEQSLEKVRNQVVALFAIFTGGRALKDFIEDVTKSDAALGRFATMLGQNAGEVATWRNAMRAMGGNVGDVDSGIQRIVSDMQQFSLTGHSQLIPYLRQLGVAYSDMNGNALSADKILENLHNRIKGMKPERATAWLQLMGFGPDMIQMLELSDDALNRLKEDGKALAAAQDADKGPAAARLEAWQKLKMTWEAAGVTLLTKLTPAILAITRALSALAAWFQANPEVSGAVFAALAGILGVVSIALTAFAVSSAWAGIVGAIGGIAGAVARLSAAMGVMALETFPAVGEAFLGLTAAIMTNPLGLVITAIVLGIATISVAIYELVTHLHELKEAWNSVMPSWLQIGTPDKTSGGAPSAPGAQRVPGAKRAPPAPATNTPTEKAAWEAAQSAEQATGIPASVTYAQWKLESGSGAHMPAGSNNPFGIKAAAGQPFVMAPTKEFRNGHMETVLGKFAKFDSLADAFKAHGQLLANSSHYAEARKHLNDPGAFADALTGVYATDPNYGSKLKNIMASLGANGPAPRFQPTLTGAPAAAMASNVANNSTSHTTTVETRIGNLNVYSSAKDAAGIAKDVHAEIQRTAFVQQSNSGQA